jgi:hypothetical protein
MSFDNNTKRNAANDTIEMESYPVLDAGVYRAKLETIDSKPSQFHDGEALQFTWRVIGGESDGETFSGFANKKLMPKSKLATWTKAHLNMNSFPDGFVLNLGSLIGKEVHITLSVGARKDGGGDCNVVQAVSPYKPTSKKAKTATPVLPDDFVEVFDGATEIPDPGDPLRAKEKKVA